MNSRSVFSSRPVLVAAALVLQAVLLVVAVAPQLSARVTGMEYRLAVGLVDPIDPLRGAYAQLDYPGLPRADGRSGPVYVPLARDGGLWKGSGVMRQRPASGPYIACESAGYARLSCGIDSLFLSQDKALRAQNELGGNRMAAIVKIDATGNAAVVGLAPR
ncbi:hypothetical protein GCM10023194_28950 [Planotetraspora phitsanulokensis]|uniref:GDYXXLXY domain-containing protein n=1 Tax=Planotetraspora phitsanulokensis TaxID=575192 RepID=A0A8J3U2X0_9ACTN|nr:GDYXXLXY domain-containing protein [Planotetraspora phitsanulokensis]GII35967.1 hypothetical protein Pph01_09700 [Planotetraspora phitsanulokensis]